MAFEKKTSISPGMFMDQYRQFAVKNRVTTFDVLFKAYCVSERDTQLILGGKIVLEYGMAIEELFAFAMACHKLCVANVNDQAEGKDAFFSNLFEYYPRDLFAFMQKHDFNSSLVDLYRLPPVDKIAKHVGQTTEIVEEGYREVGSVVETVKEDFFDNGLKDIYNKLKHPFLVAHPSIRRDLDDFLLPVFTITRDPSVIASVVPVRVDEAMLRAYRVNIVNIAHCILGFMKFVDLRFEME